VDCETCNGHGALMVRPEGCPATCAVPGRCCGRTKEWGSRPCPDCDGHDWATSHYENLGEMRAGESE
jgi:hypothetical protein